MSTMQATLDRLTAERDEQIAFVDKICGEAETDSRDLVATEQENVDRAKTRVGELDEQITRISGFLTLRASGDAASRAARDGGHQHPISGPGLRDAASLGDMFVGTDEFRAYTGRGRSGVVTVRHGRGGLNNRAAITTGADPGKAFIDVDKSFTPTNPTYQTPLLDLLNKVLVSTGFVEYVTYPAAAPLAAVVPEGGVKPEAPLTAQKVSKTLDTIAHYEIITRQAYEDSQQLVDWINGNLIRGVGDKLEALAAAALDAATLPTATGTDLLGAIRVGVAAVQSAGYRPNAVALNPMDWADLDISVLGSTLLGPVVGSQFWGLRPVPVGAVPAGTAYVGDFTAGMTLFHRGETDLYMTDSHADLFIKNELVILAERRALAAITRAEALVEVTATGGGAAVAGAAKK